MSEYDALIQKSVTVGLTVVEDERLTQLAGAKAGLAASEVVAELEALRTDNWLESGRRYREAAEKERAERREKDRARAAAARRRKFLSRVRPPAEDRLFRDRWITEEPGTPARFIADLV